mgnify:CR=1 FL=1
MFLTGFLITSCEKDDICDPSTPTTPRLVIKFYDFNNPSVLKRINTLKIVGDGMNDDNPVLNEQGTEIWNDTIAYIPLRINQDSSKFRFIINANDTDLSNDIEDILEFNYSRRDTYVSRACGFKTTFDLFGIPTKNPFVVNENENVTSGLWIKNIEVEQPNVNDENETHISIYLL